MITLYACSTSQADNAGSEEIARISHAEADITKVGTVTVNYGSFDLELISNGRLEARRRALVPFRVQEQIVNVVVLEGQSVTAGQILGRLEPFTYQKRLDDATNSYEQALIDLEDRLLGFGYSLSDTASVPDNILKMARIRSGYNNAQSALTEARRNLSHTTITAPISGVISNLEAHEQNPSSAFPHFCEVLDINTMHLVFHLLETEIGQVKTEQQVEIFPFALTGETFKGTVTSINPAVDDKGMVRITVMVPNPGRRLMDG
ncbi:RND family efflux transporter, MFP subunit [Geofilum rubicundum JCM 15548]|uniref:RND family efflux transporter, MFP subunit n=1 Tax=Geofilum rubicundum JCM 15548 TaxID=1236989 RepID=A0A0E9M0J3_9BACT|nr:RND family efflux transporter, MFP subunit [Geofilum rubicundum JCM 15548]